MLDIIRVSINVRGGNVGVSNQIEFPESVISQDSCRLDPARRSEPKPAVAASCHFATTDCPLKRSLKTDGRPRPRREKLLHRDADPFGIPLLVFRKRAQNVLEPDAPRK